MQTVLYEQEEEEDSLYPRSPQLKRVDPILRSEPEVSVPVPSRSPSAASSTGRRRRRKDPGNLPLFLALDPNQTELQRFDPLDPNESSSESDEMTEGEGVVGPTNHTHVLAGEGVTAVKSVSDGFAPPRQRVANAEELRGIAAQAHHHANNEFAPRETHEPTKVEHGDSARRYAKSHERSGRVTPLKLPPVYAEERAVERQDNPDAISPTLRKHAITIPEAAGSTLPALTSPNKDGVASSPETDTLPSFRQVAIQNAPHLNELAELATQQERRYSHHHSPSYGSATAQSPALPYHSYTHASPGYQSISATSPRSAVSDHTHYGSPPQYPGLAYYADRRPSAPTDQPGPPRLPPSLPSASSSGDSHGATGSSIDGASTAHTTPIDPPAEEIPNETTQPQNDLPQSSGALTGFKCLHDGCTAPPFQTQYLLSSHKNVHSSSRPHFCPVKECPRSEGGKGFKRKNEMIRHGLVHKSPGYICPFCPDRDHRYPRPDNLQRHVRVHHVDKDKDDEALREVLAQRIDGNGKARRKRTNTMSSA